MWSSVRSCSGEMRMKSIGFERDSEILRRKTEPGRRKGEESARKKEIFCAERQNGEREGAE